MLRRLVVVGVFVAALVPVGAVGAMAASQGANGGSAQGNQKGNADFCVPQGGFSIQEIESAGQSIGSSKDGNDNAVVCIKVLSTPDNAARHFVAIDDHARQVI